MQELNIEVCLSPLLFDTYKNPDAVVVVVDILRATSAICSAFENGARSLIPVATIDEARKYKDKGYTVAAERDGYILDFADFGNSPFNFTRDKVSGKDIVYSTTNGTMTIELAKNSKNILIGSFLNFSAIYRHLLGCESDILILCAGWKGKVNIEDTFFAGALAHQLVKSGRYKTDCDPAKIAIDIWLAGKDDKMGYIEKAAQRSRLRNKGLDDCIAFCLEADSSQIIPCVKDGVLRVLD
jgi:2-phosphosulfolactate phosphatase